MADRPLRQLEDITGIKVTVRHEDTLHMLNEAIMIYGETRGSPVVILEDAFSKDPDFLFAQLFLGCALCSDARMSSYCNKMEDPKLRSILKLLDDKERLLKYTWREQQYAKAVKLAAERYFPEYVEVLRTVLIEHPTDVIAMRLIISLTVYFASFELLRDTIARALPFWRKDHPLYPHVLSFYAFGLEETRFYEEAASLSYTCLSIDSKTPWATHTISHVVEESRDPQEGVDLLLRTRSDWEGSGLGNHILWHLTLHYHDMGDNDKALEEFDNVMQHSLRDGNIYAIVDAASLLWRLELNSCDPGEERWSKLVKLIRESPDSRGFLFLDVHKMLSFAHGKVAESAARTALAEEMIKSVHEYIDSSSEGYMKMTYQIGAPILEGLLAFGKQQYDKVLQLILPQRYKLVNIGGSWAQNQVVVLTAIKAAKEGKNIKLALALTAEMKALKPKSRTMQRLFDELLTIQNGTELS